MVKSKMIQNLKHSLRSVYHSYVRRPFILTASSVLQYAPVTSEIIGPPKGVIRSAKEWIERNNADSAKEKATYQQIHKAETLTFAPVKTIEPEQDFYDRCGLSSDASLIEGSNNGHRFLTLADTFVATLPGGRAYGCDGSIITPDDYLLVDLSLEYKRERYIRQKHNAMAQIRLPRIHHVKGTVVVLTTLSAHSYFSHWMMDLLPRISLLKEAGIDFNDVDKFYISMPKLQFQKDSLRAFGVPEEKLMDCSLNPHIKADKLIVPSPVSGVFASSAYTCNVLRQYFLKESDKNDEGPPRRLYISRASTKHRRLTNENEITEYLTTLGFTIVEPQNYSLDEQVKLFADAEVILMPLGSAMANIMYCKPGTKIIEFFNPRCVQTCSLSVCSQRDLDYYYLLAEDTGSSEHEISSDIFLPIAKLKETLHLAEII